MKDVISVLASLGFLFFSLQLPIDYFDTRGISPSILTILLGVIGFFGLISIIFFIKQSKFGRFGLIISLSLYSLIFIASGIYAYATDDMLGPLVGVVMFLIAIGFSVLAFLTLFKIEA